MNNTNINLIFTLIIIKYSLKNTINKDNTNITIINNALFYGIYLAEIMNNQLCINK